MRRVRQARTIRRALASLKAPFPEVPEFRSDIRFESVYSLQRQYAVCGKFLDSVRRFLENGGTLSPKQRRDAQEIKEYQREVFRRLPIGAHIAWRADR